MHVTRSALLTSLDAYPKVTSQAITARDGADEGWADAEPDAPGNHREAFAGVKRHGLHLGRCEDQLAGQHRAGYESREVHGVCPTVDVIEEVHGCEANHEGRQRCKGAVHDACGKAPAVPLLLSHADGSIPGRTPTAIGHRARGCDPSPRASLGLGRAAQHRSCTARKATLPEPTQRKGRIRQRRQHAVERRTDGAATRQ